MSQDTAPIGGSDTGTSLLMFNKDDKSLYATPSQKLIGSTKLTLNFIGRVTLNPKEGAIHLTKTFGHDFYVQREDMSLDSAFSFVPAWYVALADAAETVNMKVHVRMVPFTYEYTSFLQCQKMQCKLAVHYLQPLDDSVTAAGDNPVKLRRDALPSAHHPPKTTTVLPPTKKRKTGGDAAADKDRKWKAICPHLFL